MDHLDLYALRRQNALLARRLELVESVLEVTGIAGDPSTPDLSRLSRAELETTLRHITAERSRLDAFESMVRGEIKADASAS